MRRTLLQERLFSRFDPPPGRNLMGYLTALGAANRIPPQRLLDKTYPALEGTNSFAVRAIGQMTGSRAEVLMHLLAPESQRVRWTLVPGYAVKRSFSAKGARVCPRCASTDLSPEAAVSLSFYVGCARHGTALLSTCHACGGRLGFARPSWRTCGCGADLAEAPAEPLSAEVATLMTWIRDACLPGRKTGAGEEGPGHLALPELLELILLVGSADGERWRGASEKADYNRPERIAVRAASLLADWPRSFGRFVKQLVLSVADGSEGGDGGDRLLKRIDRIVASKCSPMEGMVLDAWTHALRVDRYFTVDSPFANASGSHGAPKLPASRGFQSFGAYDADASRRAAKRRRADVAKRHLFTSRTKLALECGVGRAVISELGEIGLIGVMQLAKFTLYSRPDALRVRRSFLKREVPGTDMRKTVRITVLVRRWEHLTFGQVIDAVVDGELSVSRRTRSAPGRRGDLPMLLQDFVLDRATAEAFARRHCRHLPLPSAAKELGITLAVAEELVARGHLEEGPGKTYGPRTMRTVSAASVGDFAARFTHTSEVRASMGGRASATQELRELGVPEADRLSHLFALYDRASVGRALGWTASPATLDRGGARSTA